MTAGCTESALRRSASLAQVAFRLIVRICHVQNRRVLAIGVILAGFDWRDLIVRRVGLADGEACPKSPDSDNMCAVKCGQGGPRKEVQ